MQPTLEQQIAASSELIAGLARHAASIRAIGDCFVSALRNGNKILTAGNGGSAAEAMHMSEELLGRFRDDRPALPAVSLCADGTALTCIVNDYGYEHAFSRQVEGLGARDDVLVTFSTSGNSVNLVKAVEAAKQRDMIVVCLLGRDGGSLAGMADHELIVPGQATERIQEAHQVVLHLVLDIVERAFINTEPGPGS